MPRVIAKTIKSGRNRCRRRLGRSTGQSHSLITKINENAYKKDTDELDKAIATLRNGTKKDLRAKYKEYLEKCHA